MRHDLNELFERAKGNRAKAYARYSEFSVGAVVVCADGTVFDGCNVENGSIGLSLCAERSALSAAIIGGLPAKAVTAVVVAGPDGVSCSPCGACRQWLAELAPQAAVAFWWDGALVETTTAGLMPFAFDFPGG